MKRRFYIILLFFVIIAFFGACDNVDDPSTPSTPSTGSGQADDDDDATEDDDDTGDDDDDDDNDNDDDDNDDNDDDVTNDPDSPLCEEWQSLPEDLEDPVNIHCLIEKGEFALPNPPVPAVLRVLDWNIERGHEIDNFLIQFQTDPTLSAADIILLQEVDRHCPRTGSRNIARELAQALEMDYVYGVEFVETNQGGCEHGNAILSAFPIVKTGQIRHTNFENWAEEGRLGGRMSIRAEVEIGPERLQLSSVHYTSGVNRYFRAHQTQSQETIDFLKDFGEPTIWGGDLNTGIYWIWPFFESSIFLILDDGYADALAGLPHDESWTIPERPPIPKMRLDWIFYKGLDTSGGRVLYEAPLNSLSDHMGIYADFAL